MSPTLYLRPNPRAFYLLTDTHALVFRQPNASQSKASRCVVVAEFLPLDEVDMRGLIRASRGRTVEGVLGVTSVPTERSPIPEIFLLLVSSASTLPPLLPSSTLRPSRVIAVEFHSLSTSVWDSPELAPPSQSAYPFDEDLDDPYGPQSSHNASSSSSQPQILEHPYAGMRKYLESGSFFFAEGCKWDISSRMGETNWVQAERGSARHPLETFDERFVWNSTLLSPFLAFRSGLPEDVRDELDAQSLLVPVIQGFCGSLPVSTGTWADGRPEMATLGMISRLSWKRAGARFRTRGIDDDGQVANFVETEVLLSTGSVCLSYVQVRGSVPLFWQQPSAGLQTLQQKVEITRPAQATQPAFDKHFLDLLEHYHSVHAVNLLGQRDAEAMLSAAYSDHLAGLKRTLNSTPASEKKSMDAKARGTVELTQYDFHAAVKTNGNEAVRYDLSNRLQEIADSTERFGWTAIDTASGQIVEQQQGVFRINCLDCLDRTNYVQDVVSSITLTHFLQSIESPLVTSPTFWAAHRELWADNGDRLSKIYAGTGAINTSATRSGKKTFAGLLSDATKSVGRAYITNFQDKGKQVATDMLLGMMAGQRLVVLFDPIGDSVHSALLARINDYSHTRNIHIFAGTWNLNAKTPGEALAPWLFPPNSSEADIYSIAFQEIVELNAGQILATDPAKKRMWEAHIMDAFANRKGKKSEYLLYRSEQLVGTALLVVVKSALTKSMRNVESATKKTGLQGLSGNKGGVGIRLDIADSSLCLMTCHLAAGHSNVTERNADYKTISGGLKFLKGKMIEDHEIVIWAADFNYRIGLPNHDVRDCAENDELETLLAADQLSQAMDVSEVFVGYDEGPITFRPTYKFDNGTDDYDTSEKARIPAWTDRVLFKGSALRLQEYNRADLRTSDHRPVFAIFDATIREVDHAKKDAIAREIMRSIRSNGGPLDEKAEEALNGNSAGVEMLVGKMISGNSSYSRQSASTMSGIPSNEPERRSASPVVRPNNISETPRLPPRRSTAEIQPRTTSSASSSNGKVSPPSSPSSARTQSQASANGNYPTRRPAPGIANRPSAFVPSASTLAAFSGPTISKRPPPAVPPSSSSTRSTSPSSISPVVTPSSTGDYMVVSSNGASRRAPPLPPRAVPTPNGSLDLNAPPPAGLMSPVPPDIKVLGTAVAAEDHVAEGKPAPPPTPKKPIEDAISDASTRNAQTSAVIPLVKASPSTLETVSSLGEKKSSPPPVPKKPVALRSSSATG